MYFLEYYETYDQKKKLINYIVLWYNKHLILGM